MVSDSLWPRGLYSPWNSLGQNTGMGSLSLLQGFFPTQGSSPGLTHCRWIIYKLSHKGSPSYVRGKSKRSLPTLVSKSYKSPGRDRNVWLGWKADWFWLKGNRLCFAQCGLKPLLKVVVVELLSHVWLCDCMDCSTPGFPVLHYLPECPLSWWCHPAISSSVSLSLPTLHLSQHQGFSNESALCIRWPKYWSFSFKSILPEILRVDFLYGLLVWSCCPRDSTTTVQKHQFFSTQPSLWSNSHIHTWLLENHSFDSMDLCKQNDVLCFLLHCLGLS